MKTKLRLTLDVTFDCEPRDVRHLIDNLEYLPRLAAGEGYYQMAVMQWLTCGHTKLKYVKVNDMFPTRQAMSRTDQAQFVCDMLLSVARDIVGKIKSGTVPEHWDGVQLRQYITDKVKERCDAGRFMTPGDYTKYCDIVYNASNNL